MSEQYPGGPSSADEPQQPSGAQPPPPPPGHQPPPPPPGQQAPYGQQTPYGQQPYGHQAPYGQPGPYGQQPPYAAPPPQYSTAGQPAGLGVRFVARLIDGVLLAIVGAVVGSLFGAAALDSIVATGEVSYGATALSALVGAAISLAYYTLMEANLGQTVGKMAMKLRTIGPSGSNPAPAQAFKRNVWNGLGVLGVIPFFGDLLNGLLSLVVLITIAVTISNNTVTRQGWHDNFAGGTRVVRTG